MDIIACEAFDAETLLASLKRTRLKGHDQFEIYRDAALSLERVDPDTLSPAQRYVLKPGLERTIALRDALLAHGVDIFALDGGVWVRTSEAPDERIPVLPPIIEDSREPDGRTVQIINDGMHRVYAARKLGLPITIVRARNVPGAYPYYAYALEGGWSEVEELETLPENYQKKAYRHPTNYKALFRDFNAVFPGVQKDRAKTNPSHFAA